jgi:hypothetical protein
MKISKIEQKLARLEERDKTRRRYEPRMDYSQIRCFKCNEIGHFANKCEEFNKKNKRSNNQRNNNRRVNMIEELYNKVYGSSDDESSDEEIERKIYNNRK